MRDVHPWHDLLQVLHEAGRAMERWSRSAVPSSTPQGASGCSPACPDPAAGWLGSGAPAMPKPTLLTSQSTDFPRWYQDVIAHAELADNGRVRGTMVIRPTGYALWERMQREVDDRIKAVGGQNAYFRCSSPSPTSSARPSTSRGSARSWRW